MGQDNSMRDLAREKDYRLRIVQNRMGSVLRPNNEYCKRSRAKIIKGALPGETRILASVNGRAKKVFISESCKIARVAYLDQLTNI